MAVAAAALTEENGAAARGPPNFRVSQSAPFRRGSSAGDIVRLLRCGRAQPEAVAEETDAEEAT